MRVIYNPLLGTINNKIYEINKFEKIFVKINWDKSNDHHFQRITRVALAYYKSRNEWQYDFLPCGCGNISGKIECIEINKKYKSITVKFFIGNITIEFDAFN